MEEELIEGGQISSHKYHNVFQKGLMLHDPVITLAIGRKQPDNGKGGGSCRGYPSCEDQGYRQAWDARHGMVTATLMGADDS